MSDLSAYGVYATFAVGAAAIYFLLPRAGERRSMGVAGWITLAMAGIAAVYVSQSTGVRRSGILLYVFGAMALLAALRVITHSRPVYSAVYFVAVVLAVAAILLLQAAEFLAIALVIIYAGAILVTYLFVIMLAQQPGAPAYDRRAREPFLAVAAGLILTGAVAGQSFPQRAPDSGARIVNSTSADTPASSNTVAVGGILFTNYIVVVELSAVLLLVSMVGAVALSRKKVTSEVEYERRVVLGEVGREVAPY